jgi:protein-S-isoprenylcysteine O-methyltransferase Ste14
MSDPDAIRFAAAPGAGEPETRRGPARRLLRWLQRTPVRTFLLYPLIVIAFELIRRGGTLTVVPWGALLMLWGYLQYRIVGSFRWRHGGGGPSVDVPPQRIISGGIYAYTRNPMYLGHLIFMAGLALTFWSLLALAILLINIAWFHHRVLGDEKNLRKQFGEPYEAYCARVRRWIPGVI